MGSDNEYEHQSEWVLSGYTFEGMPRLGAHFYGKDGDLNCIMIEGKEPWHRNNEVKDAFESALNENKTNKP